MHLLLLPLLLLTSCFNPMGSRSSLHFHDIEQEAARETLKVEEARIKKEQERLRFLEEKKLVWNEIITDAQTSFADIKPILEQKCFDCHDATRRLPIYARVFPRINPLTKHQVEGLKALDFSTTFPLSAKGNPSQLTLLKALQNTVLDRSMPLRSYVTVYRKRRITDEDQEKIISWIGPIIERIEDFEEHYKTEEKTPAVQILEQKCFRCHANGNAKGQFGDMQENSKLFKSKFVNLKDPAQSVLFTLSSEGKMPPNKRDALSMDELIVVREWLISVAPDYQ